MKTDNRSFIYRIDSNDVIVFVSDEWLSFASENNNGRLTRETVVQQSLWKFIVDNPTRHVYELLLLKVRKERVAVSVPFRCDSPDCRRFMELEVSSFPENLIQFKSRILKLEFRDPVLLLDSGVERTDEFLSICSWCKKVKVNSGYVEVEKAVAILGLFNNEKLPRLTHGICPECAASFARQLKV